MDEGWATALEYLIMEDVGADRQDNCSNVSRH
jgi:hypothetical protein